ncbi:MAG TPA: hypothetical protein VJ694_00070 [Patescibacteria group bacterium]|nr:hypothetical protein [Patescibacteria group bacterium]
MRTAGIDFGSTLVKAYWRAQGMERAATVGDPAGLEELAQELRLDGVRTLRFTGVGSVSYEGRLATRFEIIRARDGAIDDEIRLQAAGTRLLMPGAPRRMIVASIGTGVSYAKASGKRVKRSPLGSAHGGGTILGLGKIVGARNFRELEAAAAKGVPADLLVKQQLPATVGTPVGEMVTAHFWREDASFEDKCASVFSFAAASIAKDLAVLTSIPFSPKDIAVVGKVASSRVFRHALERWEPFLKGRKLHFPERGEYAAAAGAWADIST